MTQAPPLMMSHNVLEDTPLPWRQALVHILPGPDRLSVFQTSRCCMQLVLSHSSHMHVAINVYMAAKEESMLMMIRHILVQRASSPSSGVSITLASSDPEACGPASDLSGLEQAVSSLAPFSHVITSLDLTDMSSTGLSTSQLIAVATALPHLISLATSVPDDGFITPPQLPHLRSLVLAPAATPGLQCVAPFTPQLTSLMFHRSSRQTSLASILNRPSTNLRVLKTVPVLDDAVLVLLLQHAPNLEQLTANTVSLQSSTCAAAHWQLRKLTVKAQGMHIGMVSRLPQTSGAWELLCPMLRMQAEEAEVLRAVASHCTLYSHELHVRCLAADDTAGTVMWQWVQALHVLTWQPLLQPLEHRPSRTLSVERAAITPSMLHALGALPAGLCVKLHSQRALPAPAAALPHAAGSNLTDIQLVHLNDSLLSLLVHCAPALATLTVWDTSSLRSGAHKHSTWRLRTLHAKGAPLRLSTLALLPDVEGGQLEVGCSHLIFDLLLPQSAERVTAMVQSVRGVTQATVLPAFLYEDNAEVLATNLTVLRHLQDNIPQHITLRDWVWTRETVVQLAGLPHRDSAWQRLDITGCKWHGVEDAEQTRMLQYIPRGFRQVHISPAPSAEALRAVCQELLAQGTQRALAVYCAGEAVPLLKELVEAVLRPHGQHVHASVRVLASDSAGKDE